jgi:hypothetical protein
MRRGAVGNGGGHVRLLACYLDEAVERRPESEALVDGATPLSYRRVGARLTDHDGLPDGVVSSRRIDRVGAAQTCCCKSNFDAYANIRSHSSANRVAIAAVTGVT